jgi:tRNA-dihydrouridine synthase B
LSDTIKIILAPLHGYTEAAYREALAGNFYGFDEAVAPFIALSPAERFNTVRLRDLKPSRNTCMQVVPQILGNDGTSFIQTALALHEMGYTRLNWNLGCPKRAIAAKQRGSGLLPHPELISAILEHVVPSIPQQLSVKLRLGRNSPDEIFQVIEVLNRFPLESVTVHPRTGIEMYSKNADVDAFAKVLPLIKHPVIYNGDIFSAEDFSGLRLRFPNVKGWMIGRGVLANPFLAGQMKGIELPDCSLQRERFIRFVYQLQELYAAESRSKGYLINRMKDNWGFFAFRFYNGEEIYQKLSRVQDLDKFLELQSAFLNKAEWIDVRDNTSVFNGAKAGNKMLEG